MLFLGLIVELIWQAWVGTTCLGCTHQTLLATLAQLFLQQDDISSVAFVHRVGKIADEWNEADDEVDEDVKLHPEFDSAVQGRLDRADCAIHHQGQEKVPDVT
jgi:hypothetical protein